MVTSPKEVPKNYVVRDARWTSIGARQFVLIDVVENHHRTDLDRQRHIQAVLACDAPSHIARGYVFGFVLRLTYSGLIASGDLSCHREGEALTISGRASGHIHWRGEDTNARMPVEFQVHASAHYDAALADRLTPSHYTEAEPTMRDWLYK